MGEELNDLAQQLEELRQEVSLLKGSDEGTQPSEALERARFGQELAEMKAAKAAERIETLEERLFTAQTNVRGLREELNGHLSESKKLKSEIRYFRSLLGLKEGSSKLLRDPLEVQREAGLELAIQKRELAEECEDILKQTLADVKDAADELESATKAKSKRHWSGLIRQFSSKLNKLSESGAKLLQKTAAKQVARAEGSFDSIDQRRIRGWAWNPKNPAERLRVTLFVDGRMMESAYADNHRRDIEENGVGNGSYGFRFNTPPHCFDGRVHEYRVEVEGYDNRIANSRREFTLDGVAEEVAEEEVEFELSLPLKAGGQISSAAAAWEKVSIIIPVYNAPDDLQNCLNSLLRHTTTSHEIVLVDDCSPDPKVGEVLSGVEDRAGVRILKTPENCGFVGAVNHGLRETTGDVVLLNSDTEVPPRWLSKLRAAAATDPRIGSVTPLTNAGGAFSIPEYGKDLPLPRDLDVTAAARVVARTSQRILPEVPTGNGFCLYLRRAALDEVGLLDQETFGRGYGEENDLCMRMRARGWRNVIDDSSFVYHRGHASFGEEGTKAQLDKNLDVLFEKHPTYRELVSTAFHSPEMNAAREAVIDGWNDPKACAAAHKERVLYVLHAGQGGVMGTVVDLLKGLPDRRWEKYILTSGGTKIELGLWNPDTEEIDVVQTWNLHGSWTALRFENADLQEIYASALLSLDIDLVHIHHLFKHSFDLPEICGRLDIPYHLFLHDYYFINPSLQLLDTSGKFCRDNEVSEGAEWEVASPMFEDLPLDDAGFQELWREKCLSVLMNAEVIVSPSEVVRDIHYGIYPSLEKDGPQFLAIGHGLDTEFPITVPTINTLSGSKKVRVLCLGSLDRHKGAKLLQKVKALDSAGKLELHFLGTENPRLSKAGVQHGAYSREEVSEKIAEIAPAYCVILSIWGETFSYTMSEALACGVPVLAAGNGAPGERIRKHGGGWIAEDLSPEAVYKQMVAIGKDAKDIEAKRQEIAAMVPVSVNEMALRYDELYHQTLTPSRREKWAVYMPANDAASTFIRTILPLDHPTGRARVQPHYLDPTDLDAGHLAAYFSRNEIDRIHVQRAPFDQEDAAALLEAAKKSGTAISLDLDDDLFQVADTHPDAAEYREPVAALRDIVKVADRVTTSTKNLKDALSWIKDVTFEVVPNRLDERLWFAPLENGGRPKFRNGKPAKEGVFTIGYFGTFTHGEDLELVRDAIKDARKRLAKDGIKLRFLVAGGARPESKADAWFEALPLPKANAYPDFVAWLRSTAKGWDLGIAPLADTALNHSKSGLKLLEYSALGIPTLASEVGEYPELEGGSSCPLARP